MKPSAFARLLIVPLVAIAIDLPVAVTAYGEPPRGRGREIRQPQSRTPEPAPVAPSEMTVLVGFGILVVARQWLLPRA